MAQDMLDSHLVVVGSSAGGIDALSTLVGTLPKDFPAPIVIAQHLDPTRQSHLQDILGRRSMLPVRSVAGEEPIEKGVIYVVPSNRHVEITDHTVIVRFDSLPQPKPSVDLLLSSAAKAYGESLIAVILTGTGTDGAAGARTVKKAGGTVIIQNPDTAPYPGMPLSLAPTTVDIVADVERIGPILGDLLAGIDVPKQPDARRLLESFLDEVRERQGLDFNSYKTPTILRRLQRRIVATNSQNFEDYLEYLNAHPEEYQRLVNSFLIKVTEFFRDPELFTYLRETLLPELVVQARKRGNELRIWSAGCATGEEAYSLAILVAEALGGALEHFNIRIFATDADADAIAFARRGIYPASALAQVPEELVIRYFVREDDSYQVKKQVRTLTVFGEHDLGGRAPFPRIDLVLCRNVLIYFTPELQQRTLKLFAYSLRDGGYLALGKAESTGQLGEFFEPIQKQYKVFRRRGDRILIPPQGPSVQRPAALPRLNRATNLGHILRAENTAQRRRSQEEGVLLRLPVGIIVVDRRYDIQSINAAARRILGIYSTAIGDDLIHIARGVNQARLRAAIDDAFRKGTPTGVDEFTVEDSTSGEQYFVQITCHPQRAEEDSGPYETVIVVLHDVSTLVRARQRLEQELQSTTAEVEAERRSVEAEVAGKDEIILRLVETNRQLIEANQELTGANEELRATTEEYLLSTEEAQAATEEVETLNEELQVTNEELETLNEELQATIEELNTTNDDLHARSAELQDLAISSEEERARLAAILISMGDAVLVVDSDGRPLLSNAAYTRMFGGPSAAFTAQDDNGQPLPVAATPQARAAQGESFSMEFTLQGSDGTRRWYEANGEPIRDDSGQQQRGGVIVIRDITERSLHRMQNEFMALASHELNTPLTPLSTSLQMLLKQIGDSPEMKQTNHYAQIALEQVNRLRRLVADLLDAERLQSGKLTLHREHIDLRELVAKTAELAQSLATGQSIIFAGPDTPTYVLGDSDRLQQVLLNLLNNAITYAPHTASIDVRLRKVGNETEVQVQDYGSGIAPNELTLLFSRFYQVKRGDRPARRGLGLGLFISKQIIDAHGGTIRVESVEGKGTTFTIRLPLDEEKKPAKR